jgi:hypothetical protein
VADARPSGELLESLLERRQNAKGPVDAVLANELCELLDICLSDHATDSA